MSIILDHVNYVYGADTPLAVHALNDVCLKIPDGQFIGIIGHTGSGKSTLMQTIATLDTPDPNPATSIRIGGTELFGLKDNALTEFRREHIGFIFQAFNLVPTLNVAENMFLGREKVRGLCHLCKSEMERRAEETPRRLPELRKAAERAGARLAYLKSRKNEIIEQRVKHLFEIARKP